MTIRTIAAAGLFLFGLSVGANAQGIGQGAADGAATGRRAAGPVGSVVGGVVGGAVGGAVGGVKGVLGIPQDTRSRHHMRRGARHRRHG